MGWQSDSNYPLEGSKWTGGDGSGAGQGVGGGHLESWRCFTSYSSSGYVGEFML